MPTQRTPQPSHRTKLNVSQFSLVKHQDIKNNELGEEDKKEIITL
jgi:hypothetical protein